MKSYITKELIVDEARMLTTDCKCACIFVEGDSDERFYKLMFPASSVFIRRLDGWENVVETVQYANDNCAQGVFGLIDRDYHLLLEDGVLDTPNVLHTDENDLELMFVYSTAFDKFIGLTASSEKTKESDCREIIISAAAKLGALRYISAKSKLYLTFDGLRLRDFIDKATLDVDLQRYVEKVKDRSRSKGITVVASVDQLVAAVLETLVENSPRQLCNGHDVLDILGYSLTKRFASYDATTYPEERLYESLSMGYGKDLFEASNVFVRFRELWPNSNIPITM